MIRMIVGAVITVVLLAAGMPAEGKEKKKTKTAPVQTAPSATAGAPASAAAAAPALPKGWTEVKTNDPGLARVGYKIEGRTIIVRFKNASRDRSVRFKYQVKWKRLQGERWIDDATMEGISFRLKAQEELMRDLRNAGKEIKDVVVDVVVTAD